MSTEPIVSIAEPHERVTALGLAFGHATPGAREKRCQRLLALIERGEFPERGVLIARRDGLPVGAMLVQPLPGRSAVVTSPWAQSTADEDALVRFALAILAQADVLIAQVFLEEAELPQAEPLTRNGFRHITRIESYLRMSALSDGIRVTERPELQYENATRTPRHRLADALHRTYTGSLDIPESFTDLPAEAILAGFAHERDESLWWLVSHESGEPLGVILLGRTTTPGIGELVYLGIVPEFRGQGYAQSLLAFAIRECERCSMTDIVLSVDIRNTPAIRAYERIGFRSCQSQELFLYRF